MLIARSIPRLAAGRRSSTSPAARSALRRALCRRATATVETALVLPVLVSLVFGAIEAANGIHLRQLLGGAAYDVARIATTDGGSEADARVRGLEMLAGAGIKDALITVSPSPAESASRGSDVTVTISAPLRSNMIAGSSWFAMPTVDYRVVMVKQ